jgi:hypothetical protein
MNRKRYSIAVPHDFKNWFVIGSDDWNPHCQNPFYIAGTTEDHPLCPSVNATAAGLTCLLLYGSRGLTVVESNQAPDCLGSPGGE